MRGAPKGGPQPGDHPNLKLRRRALLRAAGASLVGWGALAPGCAHEEARFEHGVAAGDPTESSLILWTRLSGVAGSRSVRWIVAADPLLEHVLASGEAMADEERDYTVKVDATGLPAGTQVHYRFSVEAPAGTVRSPIGRAKTLASSPTSARIGVACCASLAHGFLHGYRFLAEMDLDLVLHLGDAIYEFASGEFGSLRAYDPPHECRTLADYRRRHAQYRQDDDVQALHAAHALVMLWDDHEFANDAFEDGSYWHDGASEGPWAERRDGARRAFLEWMPLRERPEAPHRIYRSITLGALARIVVLDARMDGRSVQPYDVIEQYDPERRILSPAQETWLLEELARGEVGYRIVASQVLFSHHPEIWALDAWDGYPVQRQRVLAALASSPMPPLLWLSGDSHASWASELSSAPFDPRRYDPRSGLGAIGVELGVPGISSPNLDPRDAPAEEARILRESPHHRYTEHSSRGFLVLDVDATRIRAQHFFVDGVELRAGSLREGPVHELRAGTSRWAR